MGMVMKTMFRRRLLTALFAASVATPGVILAQEYPAKTVNIVVPYAAGGSVDAVARMLAEEFRKAFGQPFVVENRVGAYGNIAADHVAKAQADGYTLLVHNASAVASSASAFKTLPFDPRKDFTPVGIIAHQPGVLVTHPSLPAKNVLEFIAHAKSRQGKLNYGVGGVFGPTHTPAVLFEMKTGIKAEPVMYKGAAPAIVDLVGGQIDFMFDTAPTSLPHISTGKLRVLAVTSAKRLFNSWIGVSAPAMTPPAIVAKLNATINKLLQEPAFKQRLKDYGLDPAGVTSPEEFGAFIKEERDLYAEIVKASGMPPL
jgi:tripartite-type tricarboxylate transporter receptor subunit TctC